VALNSGSWRCEAPQVRGLLRFPYDKIIVAAGSPEVPGALLERLKPTGRLVVALGRAGAQQLTAIDKDARGVVRRRDVIPVRFSLLETAM
jgi:protein-L-isoaspartate(D-aspartate) O-methyltransferase